MEFDTTRNKLVVSGARESRRESPFSSIQFHLLNGCQFVDFNPLENTDISWWKDITETNLNIIGTSRASHKYTNGKNTWEAEFTLPHPGVPYYVLATQDSKPIALEKFYFQQ